MKTIVLYNRPLAWFNPFAELIFFEPVFSDNNMVSETVNESPTSYSVEYSMPKFRKKDLRVRIDNDVLRVEAKSKSGNPSWFNRSKNSLENQYLRETRLSDDMDAEKINARFRNGRLTIDIPKKKEYVNYREIPIGGISEISKSEEINELSNQNLFENLKHKIEGLFKRAA
jgi:HSP20 family protein